MNILIVAEKPHHIKRIKEYLLAHKNEFKDNNYYFDCIRTVLKLNDPFFNFEQRKDGKIYCEGEIIDAKPLVLKSMDTPDKNFIISNIDFIKDKIDFSNIDMVVSVCDPDICGILGFKEYEERHQLSDSKFVINYSWTDVDCDNILSLKKLEPFSQILNRYKENGYIA